MLSIIDIESETQRENDEPRSRFGANVADAELVRRAQAGDQWAEEALFRRYVAYATRLATRLMSRRADADDVVQDVFADVLTSLHKLRDPDAFKSWLSRVVVNRCRKAFRRRKVARALGLDRGQDDASLALLASSEASPEVLAELQLADRVLSKLATEQRTAWLLRYAQGETLESVADLTGCSLATAKRRIAAAQKTLRASFPEGSA